MSRHDIRTLPPDERDELVHRDGQREPLRCWTGGSAVQSALDELWPAYRTSGEDWISGVTSAKRRSRITAAEERRLWRRLEPFHDRLPALRVYPVDYGRHAELAIPPESCVVAIGDRDPDGRRYADAIVDAARLLATAQGKATTAS